MQCTLKSSLMGEMKPRHNNLSMQSINVIPTILQRPTNGQLSQMTLNGLLERVKDAFFGPALAALSGEALQPPLSSYRHGDKENAF